MNITKRSHRGPFVEWNQQMCSIWSHTLTQSAFFQVIQKTSSAEPVSHQGGAINTQASELHQLWCQSLGPTAASVPTPFKVTAQTHICRLFMHIWVEGTAHILSDGLCYRLTFFYSLLLFILTYFYSRSALPLCWQQRNIFELSFHVIFIQFLSG